MSLTMKMVPGGLRVVDAVYFDGQSNCLGTGDGNDFASAGLDVGSLGFDLLAPMPRVLIYYYSNSALEPLNIPTNNMSANQDAYSYGGSSIHPTWAAFGPELGYAYAWLQDHPSGTLLILKDSADGQPIAAFAAGTARDNLRITRHAAAKAALRSRGMLARIKGMCWIQGESDAASNQATYQAALSQRIADWRTDGSIEPATKIVLAQITPGTLGYGAGVSAAKAAIAAADPAHIQTMPYVDSFRGDNLHLDTYGALRQGANFYAAVYGVTPVSLPGD